MRGAALLLAVALAGCVVELPDAAAPQDAGHPWTQTTAALWVARDLRCGFAAGADEPCATLTLLYRDGSVLQATYSIGAAEASPAGLHFANADDEAAFRDEIAGAWAAINGSATDPVRVAAVRAWRLDPGEREDILRVVEHAVDQAKPLREPTFDCQDCAAPAYWTFGLPQRLSDQRFGSPPPADRAWRLLETQMLALQEWLDGSPA